MFDFNFDGEIDAIEMALGCMMIDELEKEEEKQRAQQYSFSQLEIRDDEFDLFSDTEDFDDDLY